MIIPVQFTNCRSVICLHLTTPYYLFLFMAPVQQLLMEVSPHDMDVEMFRPGEDDRLEGSTSRYAD